jgi:hypothetical protein
MYKMNYIILLVCMVLGVLILFSGRIIHSPVFFMVGIVCIVTALVYLYISYPPSPQLYDFDTSGNNLYTPSTTHSYIDPSSGYVTIYFSIIPYAQSYTVTAWGPDIITSTGISSPLIVTGINQAGTYTCTVMATTPFGTSISSKESHSFQIYPVYPPTITSVTLSLNTFTINFTEDVKTKTYPALTHDVTCTYLPSGMTKTQSITKTVTGLSPLLFILDTIQDDTEYQFTIISKSVFINSNASNMVAYTLQTTPVNINTITLTNNTFTITYTNNNNSLGTLSYSYTTYIVSDETPDGIPNTIQDPPVTISHTIQLTNKQSVDVFIKNLVYVPITFTLLINGKTHEKTYIPTGPSGCPSQSECLSYPINKHVSCWDNTDPHSIIHFTFRVPSNTNLFRLYYIGTSVGDIPSLFSLTTISKDPAHYFKQTHTKLANNTVNLSTNSSIFTDTLYYVFLFQALDLTNTTTITMPVIINSSSLTNCTS